jgi:hypothetical protein
VEAQIVVASGATVRVLDVDGTARITPDLTPYP